MSLYLTSPKIVEVYSENKIGDRSSVRRVENQIVRTVRKKYELKLTQ